MTVESTLHSLLASLVASRVYPDVAPEGTARPYITYQQVGGRSPVYIEGALPTTKNGRFQLSIWSTSRASTAALALQAEAALVASTTLQAEPVGAPVAVHEPDTGLYGALQDFSVWSPR
jgi:hypothetical protein